MKHFGHVFTCCQSYFILFGNRRVLVFYVSFVTSVTLPSKSCVHGVMEMYLTKYIHTCKKNESCCLYESDVQ